MKMKADYINENKWCDDNTPAGVKVKNLTSSWQNGMAFGGLIANFRPDILDINELDPGMSQTL